MSSATSAYPAPRLAPGLYVVSTRIGNLRDITIRALETLAAANVVLCEDTRTSATLVDHYGIRTDRQAHYELTSGSGSSRSSRRSRWCLPSR